MKANFSLISLLLALELVSAVNLVPPELTINDIVAPEVLNVNSRMASIASDDYQPGVYNARFFEQSVDHKKKDTFKQRYYVNADYYKPGGPSFLYISGEAANSPYQVSRGLGAYLAKKHNGILFSLEHRYYGVSLPFKSLNATTLKYLSSDYGLKDLGKFAKNIEDPVTKRKLPNSTKWYAIGGSYAGAMAAWVRQDYPNIFDGAIASSGPVEAKSDFFEYDLTVGKVLGEQCLDTMNEVTQYVDKLYETDKARFSQIKNSLGCQDLKDDVQFLYTVADTLAYMVQYSRPTSNPSVTSFCDGFKNKISVEDKLKNVVDTFQLFYKNNGFTCPAFASEADLNNPTPGEDSIMRQWNYQCCTEFGYWQTAPSAKVSAQKSTRSKYLTVDWFNNFFCSSKLYGKYVGPPDTNRINYRHAGKYIGTDRIIFTNGDKDPWSQLSVTDVKQSRKNRPVLMIKDGSHVTDLGTPNPKDSQSLQDTHKVMIDTIDRWVNRKY